MDREGGGMPPPMEPPLLLLLTVLSSAGGLALLLGLLLALLLVLLLAGPRGPAEPEKPFWCGRRRGEVVGGGRCLGVKGEGWECSLLTTPIITLGLLCGRVATVTSLWCWPGAPFMSP